MTNIERARRLIEQIRSLGTNDFCTCAGSRNSPLLAILGSPATQRPSDPATHLFSFVDERSAAFFALGRVKQHGKPAAVVTTSGTAVAELFPAVVEAYYSALPLVLVTADRPARFRGSGAPQAIEQIGIFGSYAATSLDGWNRATPLHINIEFDEPLIDE
jgi:2-succinyl-5-enolpyruvyl-6-hydroxy-3-cyclohexene-1-carboxylate synthase